MSAGSIKAAERHRQTIVDKLGMRDRVEQTGVRGLLSAQLAAEPRRVDGLRLALRDATGT